jgi:hypothetical protein
MLRRICWLIWALSLLSGCADSSPGCHAQADAASAGTYRGGGISLLTCW